MGEGPGHNPSLENTAKKIGDQAKGREAFAPVRNPIEKQETDKSVENGDQRKPSQKDVQGNDSSGQQSDSTNTSARRGHTGAGEKEKSTDFTALQEQDQKRLAEVREELRKNQSFKP